MENSISVHQLSVSYDDISAIKNISFQSDGGKLVGIIGPNGAGKSTLIKAILGLTPTDKGEVTFNNCSLKEVRKQIAYVPQRNAIDWNFPITVLDTVTLGTYPGLGVFHRPKKQEKQWAYECLKQVGMESFSKKQIGELSGGQQQRIFLARALAQQASYFFLDEPFVGIDISSEGTIISILKKLRNEGKTVFVVHHDLTKVNDYFDDLLLINHVLIKYGSVQSVIQPDTMKKAYRTDFSLLNTLGGGD